MKKVFLLITAVLPGMLFAQEKKSGKDVEQIIITKKGADNGKMNIVVDGENITVNGKPLKGDEKGDITVKRMKIKDLDNFSGVPGEDWSDGARSYRSFGNMNYTPLAANKAMLGVTTEKTEEGVTVRSVSDESAAEKSGIKEGDIITEVGGNTIDNVDIAMHEINAGKREGHINMKVRRNGNTKNVEIIFPKDRKTKDL